MNANQDIIKIISYKLGLDEMIITLLFNRGLNTEEKIKTFLYGTLEDLEPISIFKDAPKIRNLIFNHLNKNSKIIIYGDYDCDGIMASSMLYLALKKIGGNIEVFIPDRKEDGYGLNISSLSNLIDTKRPQLIITVDCGITAISEVKYLINQGVDIIVTDHHVPTDELPDCLIMNPHLVHGSTPLCGAGVVYKLIECLFGVNESKLYIDLCAIATIADIVPLIGDNRILAKEGLSFLSKYHKRAGLDCLFKKFNITYPQIIKSNDIAFKIAPTLNSSGRLSSAVKSLELMITEDEKYAKVLAEELYLENESRKTITEDVFNKAQELLIDYDLSKNTIIVLKGNWEAGVLGIAANKLVDKFNRPTILFANGNNILKGSCRSIKGINILELLDQCSELIDNYGGHSMAAGITIDASNFEAFVEKINLISAKIYEPNAFKYKLDYDIDFDYNNLNIEIAHQLALLEPYGHSNPKPLFKTLKNEIKCEQIKLSTHLKSRLNNNVELIMFNKLEHFHLLKNNISKNLYYSVDINEFRNKKTVQCNIKDIEYKNTYLDDSFLAIESLKRFLVNSNDNKSTKTKFYTPTKYFGKILLAFTNETFNHLSSKFPNYNRNIIKLQSSNVFNTILLAPSKDENFKYFEEIIVFDNPPEEYLKNLISSYGNVVKIGEVNNLSTLKFKKYKFNRNSLAKMYRVIRALENIKLTSIYSEALKIDPSISFFDLFASLLIFNELKIVSLDESMLKFSNTKKDLNNSKIYSFIKSNNMD